MNSTTITKTRRHTKAALAAVITAATLATLSVVPTQAEAACVVGVRSNDVLNMRSAATVNSRIVAAIRPNRCGITILSRSGNWGYISVAGRQGWVNLRFIAERDEGGDGNGINQATFGCVVGVRSNDVLNIRRGRSARTPIVGIIGPRACGVRIVDRRGNWLRVRYRGVSGWVASRFMDY